MDVQFKFENVDDVQATLTVTMTVGEWRALKTQLAVTEHPSWRLGNAIRDVIYKAETTFYADHKAP